MGRNPGMPPGKPDRGPTPYQLAVQSVIMNNNWLNQMGIEIEVYSNSGLEKFRHNIFYINHPDIDMFKNDFWKNIRVREQKPLELKIKKVWDMIALIEHIRYDYSEFLEKLRRVGRVA